MLACAGASLRMAANPGAVSLNRFGGHSQYAAELQRLPDRPRGRRARGQPRAGADALGTGAYWWNKPLKELRLATFNARIETVTTKPFFREPFKHRRCLIPVSGYYEWQNTPNGKQPWYFTARDGSPILTVAGLWDQWENKETGERLKSCTMVISDPNDFVGEVHDRMPVLLMPEQFDHWLSGNMGIEALKPISDDYLQRWAVSQ
jgi:putative SOS response-associated peptidase YedK